tara:strand:- start:76819 stop:77358 length:540 start_codon:yes stop_codon:yes gene_type:complete
MVTETITGDECQAILEKAQTVYSDKRIGDASDTSPSSTFLTYGKNFCASVLAHAGGKGYITRAQYDPIASFFERYNDIIELNKSYEPGLKEHALDLLAKTLEFADVVAQEFRNISGYRNKITARRDQIEQGEYFWQLHVEPAFYFVEKFIDHVDEDVKHDELLDGLEALVERTNAHMEE